MVLGFGHCAKPIIDILRGMKADVSVAVRNEKYQKEIIEKGCHYIPIEAIDLKNQDILINTVPHLLITKKHLDQASSSLMIVDIASYPYGIDHHYALSLGLNSLILPSIPCKYAYGYAGEMMADMIERKMNHA